MKKQLSVIYIKVRLEITANEGTDIDTVISDMDYHFVSATEEAVISRTEITEQSKATVIGIDSSKWKEVRNTHEDERGIVIDAWLTEDDNEDGKVIATIKDGLVTYIDQDAITDYLAQEKISEILLIK